MAVAIEARSLSPLTELAANPPKNLSYTVQDVQTPLVLYIARVPGSRDVYLSSLKPREKIVTAQDVKSSLYYLHVDSADDERLRKTSGTAGDGIARPPIDGDMVGDEKLPLPLVRQSSSIDRSQASLPCHPQTQRFAAERRSEAQVKRNPLPHTIQNHQRTLTSLSQAPAELLPDLPLRRPLGPRALYERLRSVDSSAFQAQEQKENTNLRRSFETHLSTPYLPPRSNISRKEDQRGTEPSPHMWKAPDSSRILDNSQHAPHSDYIPLQARFGASSSSVADYDSQAFSITVIRRDPGSGDQWNIGRITSLPENRNNCVHSNLRNVASSGVAIEIMNSGYTKFLNATDTYPLQNLPNSNSPRSAMNPKKLISSAKDESIQEICSFRRQILTNRTSSRASDEGKRLSQSTEISRESADSRFKNDFRRAHEKSNSANEHIPSHLVLPVNKAFTFLSPWNGDCEFSTGIAGRSLKCKHTLPYQPTSSGRRLLSSNPVSEIRFNLPNSKVFGRPSPKAVDGRSSLRSSFFSTTRTRRPSLYTNSASIEDEYNDDRDDMMDLSLGQEHAGGGFGGKRAKLGKLIVEEEGLKMLDLVVTANMGIWWRVYEKASRE